MRTLQNWIDVQSVTGHEADYADALALHLTGLGFDVERQELEPGRFNLLARTGVPEVVFCTHLDTVPPWFGPREDREFVHGLIQDGYQELPEPLLPYLQKDKSDDEAESERLVCHCGYGNSETWTHI